LVYVNVCVEVVPTRVSGNVRLDALRLATGLLAVPERLTLTGPAGVSLLMLKVALSGPDLKGAKTTFSWHDAPGAIADVVAPVEQVALGFPGTNSLLLGPLNPRMPSWTLRTPTLFTVTLCGELTS
jgi:hypothetical protein